MRGAIDELSKTFGLAKISADRASAVTARYPWQSSRWSSCATGDGAETTYVALDLKNSAF